jgi:hypothetical protein
VAFTRVIAIPLLLCAALTAQSFGGTALNAIDGQPLAGVHIKLFSLSLSGGPGDAYGAMSASDGRFSIAAIPPGTYIVLGERTGFVHMMTPSGAIPIPTVNLKAADRITDYKLELTPRASIHVRVVDDYGDPVANVSVNAAPVSSSGPIAASLNGNQTVYTNELGETRITGGPGKYTIKATPNSAAPAREIRTDGTSELIYGPTWYPSAPASSSAAPIEVAAGTNASIEVRLVRQRSITISGTVNGMPPDASGTVMLATFDRAGGQRVNSRSTPIGPGGKFMFLSMPAAHYRMTALVYRSPSPLQSQSLEYTPDSPDAHDVQLTLALGAQLSGTLQMAGEPPGAAAEKRTITLAPTESTASPTGTTGDDGSFKIADIFPGRYRVEVSPLPDNGYVQSVELDGAASTSPELDFSRGVHGSRLKITLARDAAQLSGTVFDKDGQPLGHTVALVIVTADRDHITPNQDGLIKEGGKYGFKNIRPGKYWVFAMDVFRSGSVETETDLKRMAAAAEEIEIKPGDRIVKDLKVVLKEDVDARSKK